MEIIAREVAARAQDNFLVAQMITDELLSRPPLTAVAEGWSDVLAWPSDFAGWMDRDLDRRLGAEDRWLADALIPLAYAGRDGLPFDLWVDALPRFELDRRVDAPGVQRALELLGFFIVKTNPPRSSGKPGYQLRHQRFAEYFRRGQLTARRERAMAEVVLGSVPTSLGGIRRWPEMSPYARQNLLAHATRAGCIDELLAADPLCLAAVDLTAALDAVRTPHSPTGRSLARLLRRAAFGMDAGYAERRSRLEFHARLAGDWQLADAFARPIADGPDAVDDPAWRTPWRAGGPPAAVPDGGPMKTRAVLPVAWWSPAAVVIDDDFNAEAMDLASRSPLGPRVRPRGPAGATPELWSAREIAGSVYLAVGWEVGELEVWCLAGPSASPRVLASHRVRAAVRSIEVFAGPGGIPLLAVLVSSRPGTLLILTTADRQLRLLGDGGLAGGDGVMGLNGTEEAGQLVVASLSSGLGLRALRISAAAEEPAVVQARDDPTTLLRAAGDATEAVALINVDSEIRMVVLRAQAVEVVEGSLGRAGRTARPALRYADGSARAVVLAEDRLLCWDLLPEPSLLFERPTLGRARDAQYLDPEGTLVALSGWGGDVEILVLADEEAVAVLPALPAGESGTAVLPVPFGDAIASTVLTRAVGGITKIWFVDRAEAKTATATDNWGVVTAIGAASGRSSSMLAATDGTSSVSVWRLPSDPGSPQQARRFAHSEDVELVAVAAGAEHSAVVAVGDTRASVWTLPERAERPAALQSFELLPGLAEHLTVASYGPRTVVATAGPEGLQLWLVRGDHAPAVLAASLDVPIGALTLVGASESGVMVAAAGEDDSLHVLTIGREGRVDDRWVSSPDAIEGCVDMVGPSGEPYVATASHAGTIRVWDVSGADVVLRETLSTLDGPRLMVAAGSVLVFPVPGGVVCWDVFGGTDGITRLQTRGQRPGHLTVVGEGPQRRVLCAYTSGTISVIEPLVGAVYDLELNCEFSNMVGLANPSWVVASHGSALIALQLT